VPAYRFEDQLRARALEFVRALERAGVTAAIVDNSLREYSIKVSVSQNERDFGAAIVYYKPTSDSFSMRMHELKDKSIAPLLEACWHGAPQRVDEHRNSGYEVYVDGSFSGGATGYGAVILKDGKVVEELFGAVDSSEVAGTYQIAGELAGVKHALTWCRKHSVKQVSIYYDYLGIEKWATRKWKANQPVTQAYAQFIRECPIKIHWHKVDSHTGDRWNDRADTLAKKGAQSMKPDDAEKELISELIEKTESWIGFLMLRGIDAAFDRVYNELYARVIVLVDDQALGTFDLYNTKKKKFSPYLHNFRDEELKAQIESLWQEFASRRQ
jgi:ribonuclease HI